METVTSTIEFDVTLSTLEISAVKKLVGNETKFTILKDAKLVVKIRVEVKKYPEAPKV